jgi:molecular chaperone DnaJ
MKGDYYEILGIPRDATKEEAKDAYRRLALQYHPDRNKSPDAEEMFKEISEAYAVLSDDERRREYDEFGHPGIDQRYTYEEIIRTTDFESVFKDLEFDFGGLHRIFGMLFGRGGVGQVAEGSDLGYDLEISLEEVATGTTRRLTVPGRETCDVCRGAKVMAGFLCQNCQGTGIVEYGREITLDIPPGIERGMQLRLVGKGESDPGMPPGDLFVRVNVKTHNIFERDGDNIYCEVPIGFADAALGTDIQVPTLNGVTNLRIPQGTQPGTVFCLRGKGLPQFARRDKGDLLIKINVRTPTNLTERQMRILDEFRREESLETFVSSRRS